MADLSSFTHKWRATINNNQQTNNDSRITKRNRQPVSCQQCRVRKLKCDRGHPCDGCTKRGEGPGCVYGKPSAISSTTLPRKDDTRLANQKAQDRLKHLEDLVRGMIEPPANLPTPSESPHSRSNQEDSASVPLEEGTLSRTLNEGGSYTGSTHWSAILQHIHELKNDISADNPVEEAADCSKPDALFGAENPPSLNHVLRTYLPSRIEVDRQISQYFNAKYMILPIIHVNQFRRQYEKFWQDPLSANPLWVSIMFSTCSLAAALSFVSNQSPSFDTEAVHPKDLFRTAAGQCLVLSNYSKPQPYVVEALALFLQCKYAASIDPQREVTIMFGVLTRLSYLMGYHRDASSFSHKFTPFEGEMRRRVWAMVKQFDLLVSFQLGLPNTVAPNSWDTRPPSNLHDADFDEHTQALPPTRPETDATQILYFVVKARFIDIYCNVCHHAISFPPNPPSMSDIMSLDSEIRAQVEKIPECLRIRPVSQSITDQAHEIVVRLNISFLWQKALCVLHRKYMMSDGNEYSRKTCIETASAMCESIIDLYPEFQPGGRYPDSGWMLTSFTITDFLLAIIILCLALSISRKKFVRAGGQVQQWLMLDATRDVLVILEKSHGICKDFGQKSREAIRVSGVLSAVLERLRTFNQGSTVIAGKFRADLGMLDAIMSENRPHHTKRGIDRDSVNLSGLTLTEHVKQSINLTASQCPLQLQDCTPDLPLLNESSTESSAWSSSPSATFFRRSSQQFEGYSYERSKFSDIAAAPMGFNMDTDPALSPFSGILSGFEANNFNSIDWTQFDQLTGPFEQDSGIDASSGLESVAIVGDQKALSNETQFANYENWESAPYYALGGRSRDPVTGESRPS
ncbi:hypothetical protein LTR64_002867 [Lithohypha guttulata]|uniref:uncharacterized protein n=1 Tax=Lithohypha guttulata TaxID=1690604 RepID=UPI002DDF9140|nr:hypothetical protein LTR51_000909 [Lithohypha guttulata]